MDYEMPFQTLPTKAITPKGREADIRRFSEDGELVELAINGELMSFRCDRLVFKFGPVQPLYLFRRPPAKPAAVPALKLPEAVPA